MKNIQRMSYSTTQFLGLSSGPHHRVVNSLSPREVAKLSANHSLDEVTVLVMCEIVLDDVMTEGGEEAVSVAMIVFAHLSRVVSTVPVALGVTGLRDIVLLPSLYQIHRIPGLVQMSSQ